MEPEVSLPYSQEPATSPYPQPDESSPSYLMSLTSILISSNHLCLGLPRRLLPSGFPTKTLYALLFSHMRTTDTVHLTLLDLIILIIRVFGQEYKL
jgi:hypothetical protein